MSQNSPRAEIQKSDGDEYVEIIDDPDAYLRNEIKLRDKYLSYLRMEEQKQRAAAVEGLLALSKGEIKKTAGATTNDKSSCQELIPMMSDISPPEATSVVSSTGPEERTPSVIEESEYQQMKALLDPPKKRAKWTPEVMAVLIEEFNRNKFPTRMDIVRLSTRFDVTQIQVQTWFTNRRYAENKRNQRLIKATIGKYAVPNNDSNAPPKAENVVGHVPLYPHPFMTANNRIFPTIDPAARPNFNMPAPQLQPAAIHPLFQNPIFWHLTKEFPTTHPVLQRTLSQRNNMQ